MACMEHECYDCGNVWFDNYPRSPCKACGSSNVGHFFDELPDQSDYDDDE